MEKIRRQDIELLRIVSSFGIVFFHATGNEISYAALVIFAILSMFLVGVEKVEVTVDLVKKRIKRFVIPWLAWFVVYGVINLVRGDGFLPAENGLVSGVLSGSSIHLWYIPFIFFCVLIYDVVKNNFSARVVSNISPVFASLLLVSTPFWRGLSIELGAPLAQYAHAFAAVFIGVSFSYFCVERKYFSILFFVLIVASSIAVFSFKGVGVTYFVAILCSLLLISKIGEKFQRINFLPISQCMLGVYFVHIIILNLVGGFLPEAGLFRPFLVFLTSTIAVYIARKLFPKIACYWS